MDRPNIVVMIAHDLGRHLHCCGVPTVRTPNLDQFARDGVRFAQSFCVAPQCSPSRAALFTGRYPHQNGVLGLTHSHFAWDLHADENHLAHLLRADGFRTALVGLQHETRRPQAMGWETITPAATPLPRAESHRTGAHRVAFHAAAAIAEFTETESDTPFYLQIGFFEPHRAPGTPGGFGVETPGDEHDVWIPAHILDDDAARDEFRSYEAAIRMLDSAVGEILAALAAAPPEVRDNTLVVFTTDHGIPFPRAKCSVYEPGLQTCLLMRWPAGGIGGGTVFDPLIPHIDIFATLLDIAGIAPPPNIEGRTFLPLLRGEGYTPRDAIFGELTFHDYTDPVRSIRTDRWKLIANFSSAPSFMDPSQSWRPRCTPVVPADPSLAYHPPIELYDLETDPNETKNLADVPAHAAVRADLLRRLHAHMTDTNDPLLVGIPLAPLHRQTLSLLSGTL